MQPMVQRRGQEQRDQAGPVDAAGDDPPWIGDTDRQIEHPRQTGDTQKQASTMTGRVDNLLGRTVLRLCVLNAYLSRLGERLFALAEIDTPGASALPQNVKQHGQ